MSKELSTKLRYFGHDVNQFCQVQRAIEQFQQTDSYADLEALLREYQSSDGLRAHTYSICPQKGVKTDSVAKTVIHTETIQNAFKTVLGSLNGLEEVKTTGYHVSGVISSGLIRLSCELRDPIL